MIATVHYPKIKWLDNLISSYFRSEQKIDLYIAISESEKELFKDYFEFYEPDKFIICPNVESAVNPITYKKMWALHELHKQKMYEGIACIDVECEFLKNGGFYESFNRFSKIREIVCYPTDVDFLVNIQRISSQYFPENAELSKFKKLCSVWNSIPWYISETLDEFFADVKYDEHQFSKCEWEVFDHLCYEAWLISKEYFWISHKEYRLEYPEDMPPEKRKMLYNEKLDWIRYGSRHLKCLQNQNPLMYFHVDRDNRSDQID